MPIQSKQQPPYYTTTEPFKQFIAICNQAGTASAPTIDYIIKNTIGTTPTWTYDGVGIYSILITNDPYKTTIQASMAQYNGALRNLIAGTEEDPTYLIIKCKDKDSLAAEIGGLFYLIINLYQ